MRLFWQEMRKIWRPGILAVIVLLGAMFYWVRPDYYREYYNGGLSGGNHEIYHLSAEWAEKYGTTMEQSEREELDLQLAEEKEIFSRMLADIPEAADAEFTDYEGFVAFIEIHHNAYRGDESYHAGELFTQRERLIRRVQGGTNYGRIEDLDTFLFRYDHFLESPASARENFHTVYTPREQARILELEARDQRGYLPSGLGTATSLYFRYLAFWNALGVILLLAPFLVRDRMRRVRSMQWASRTGCRTLAVQMAAGSASALLFSILSAAVYSALFLVNGMLVFKDFPLYSPVMGGYTWFDMTYGQYIFALIGLALAAGLIAGALTLFLSYYSGNYVAILLKAVPLYLALWMALNELESGILFFHWTYLLNGALRLRWPKGLDLALFVLLLAAGWGLCLWTCARQRRRDL